MDQTTTQNTITTQAQPSQSETVHQNPIQIGAAWNKSSKKGNNYISVAAVGSREQDQYELVLRHKETQSELDLFNHEVCSVIILPNQFKTSKPEDSKKPDFALKVFLKE